MNEHDDARHDDTTSGAAAGGGAGRDATDAGTAPGTSPSASPDEAGTVGSPEAPPTAPSRRRRRTVLIGAGVLLFVLGAGAAVGIGRTAASHRPEASVAAYLEALRQGEAERALELDGTEVGDGDVLLTDEVYQAATDRVSGFRLAEPSVDGDTATVVATVQQGGEGGLSWQQTFTLEKDGRDLLVFDRWALQPVDLGTVTVQVGAPASATVAVGDVEVPRGDGGTVEVRALPGTYDVALGGGGDAWGAPATSGTASGPDSLGVPAVLEATLTEAGQAASRTAVDAWVAGCVASPDPQPEGCSFALLNGDGGYTLSNQKWTLETAPVYEVGDWDGTGWRVSSVTSGSVSYSADARDASGATGTFGSVSPVPVRVSGTVTDVTPAGAAFTAGPFL